MAADVKAISFWLQRNQAVRWIFMGFKALLFGDQNVLLVPTNESQISYWREPGSDDERGEHE